jgi:MFS family permease
VSTVENQKWRVLCFAGLGVVLAMSVWFSATAITFELTEHFQLTSGQRTWLTTAVQAGFVIGALTSSFLSLADVYRLTHIMTISAVLAAVANTYILFEPSVAGLIAARFVTGIALAGIYPPAMKFIATWFQKGRGVAMGSMVGALTLGSASPHLIGAFDIGLDWTVVIKLSSVAVLLSALIFYFLKEGPFSFAKTTVDLRQIGQIIRNKPVMLANLGYFGHMWELYAMWGWFLAYATAANQEAGLTLNASLLAFCVIALGTPSSIIAGFAADRFGRAMTCCVILAISGSCAVLIGFVFTGPTWLFLIVAAVWGLTIVADSAQFSTSVTEHSPSNLVGSALAFQMGVGFLITILALSVVPIMAEAMGSWRWTFLILVPGPILGIWAMLRLRAYEK